MERGLRLGEKPSLYWQSGPLPAQANTSPQSRSVFEQAQERLSTEVAQEEAVEETASGMSLSMGNRVGLKSIRTQKQEMLQHTRAKKALKKLVDSQLRQPEFTDWIEQFRVLAEGDDPETELQAEGLSAGAKLLLVSGLIAQKSLSEKKKKRLQVIQDQATSEHGWSMDVCAFLEVGTLSEEDLKQLKTLYQHGYDQSGISGMAAWFEQIRHMPDRRKRIRALLRALAFDLTITIDGEIPIRIAATFSDLQRLWLFLGVEDQARDLDAAFSFPPDTALDELLWFLQQHWIFPEGIQERVRALPLDPHYYLFYFDALASIVRHLPAACFQDPDQSAQINAALMAFHPQSPGAFQAFH